MLSVSHTKAQMEGFIKIAAIFVMNLTYPPNLFDVVLLCKQYYLILLYNHRPTYKTSYQ